MIPFAINIAIALLFLGVGLVLSNVAPHILGSILIIIGLIVFLVITIAKICETIWVGRRGWIAIFIHNATSITSDDLQRTLKRGNRLSWTSPLPQSEEDTYRIHLDKWRMIDGLEFYELSSNEEFSMNWTICLEGYQRQPIRVPISGNGRIVVEFPPTKIYSISVKIKEPIALQQNNTPYHWRIESIYLREVKLKLFNWCIRSKI